MGQIYHRYKQHSTIIIDIRAADTICSWQIRLHAVQSPHRWWKGIVHTGKRRREEAVGVSFCAEGMEPALEPHMKVWRRPALRVWKRNVRQERKLELSRSKRVVPPDELAPDRDIRGLFIWIGKFSELPYYTKSSPVPCCKKIITTRKEVVIWQRKRNW